MTNIGFRLTAALLLASIGAGCTTAYDYDGRPRQVVEPGAAILGAAAVGLLAYGLASSHHDHDDGHRYRHQSAGRRYYGPGAYGPGAYGYGNYGNRGYYNPGYCRY